MPHSLTDAHDLRIVWYADFAKMTLTMKCDFISPRLIIDFLEYLHEHDETFVKIGIIGAIEITKRFKVRLDLPRSNILFDVHAYRLFSLKENAVPDQELELLPVVSTVGEVIETLKNNHMSEDTILNGWKRV